MTANQLLSLALAMLVLGAMPSTSVAVVVGRAAAGGFRHGALATAGIVVGDVVYVVAALLGLDLIGTLLGTYADYLSVAAAAILLWIGIALWRAGDASLRAARPVVASASSSFATGLLVTLGDYKVLLFYLGFLPAFIDLRSLSVEDGLSVVAAVVVALGGVKLAYAWLAARSSSMLTPRAGALMSRLAGCVLMLAAALLITRLIAGRA